MNAVAALPMITMSSPPEEVAPPLAEPPANDAPPSALPLPRHFRAKRLKDAWADLLEATPAELHTKENRFTFEFAAMLMAKMRGGLPMTATESKELKKHMIALGLAKDDDDGPGKKGRRNDKYFDKPRGDS